jgi:hypothetical protein
MTLRYHALLVAGLVCGLVDAHAGQQPPLGAACAAEHAIERFDRFVQDRFLDTDERLGLSRIVDPSDFHHTLRRFRPETEGERATIRDLERAGIDVVLYLAGRSLIGTGDASPLPPSWARRAMAGPVVVTDTRAPADLPAPADLTADARRAFEVFARADTLAFERAGWRFKATAIRASHAECLQCHRGASATAGRPARPAPALGDALGVVIYGYRDAAALATN